MSSSYRELITLSDDELIKEHDKLAKSTQPGIKYYLDELRRRDTDRVNQKMTELTIKVTKMTGRIEVLTGVAVGCSVVSILIAVFK